MNIAHAVNATTSTSTSGNNIQINSSSTQAAVGSDILLEDYGDLSKDLKTVLKDQNATSSQILAEYTNLLVRIAFGLGSIVAVIMLVIGGAKYVTGQTFSKKSDGKSEVARSLGAIVILAASFIVFAQINPEILRVRFTPISPLGDLKGEITLGGLYEDPGDGEVIEADASISQ